MSQQASQSGQRHSAVSRLSLPKAGSHSILLRRFTASPEDLQKHVHFQSKEYLQRNYGGSKSDSEMEFINIMNESCGISLQLIIEVTLLVLFMMSKNVHKYTSATGTFLEVRCKIPELEKHFNFSALLNISVKNLRPTFVDSLNRHFCYYDTRNYTDLAERNDYNYDLIMKEIHGEAEDPKQKPCDGFVTQVRKPSPGLHPLLKICTLRQEYNLYCGDSIWYWSLFVAYRFGSALGSVIGGIIADIYGRKMCFILSAGLHITGMLCFLIPEKVFLVVGRFLMGFDSIACVALFTLVLEMCSDIMVYWIGIFMSLYLPFAALISTLLRYFIKHWKYMHLANTSTTAIALFAMWYLTESPKWLRFTRSQSEAYNVLKQRNPLTQLPTNLSHEIHKRPTLKRIRKQLLRPIFRSRLIITIFIYIAEAISLNIEINMRRTEYTRIEFFVSSATFEMIYILATCILALKCGRRGAMVVLFGFLVTVSSILFMLDKGTDNAAFHILSSFHFGMAETILALLRFYTVEMYPTNCRMSAVGISRAAYYTGELVLYCRSHRFHPHAKPLYFMPPFVASITCLLLVTFLPKTNNKGLPNTPRDALFERNSL